MTFEDFANLTYGEQLHYVTTHFEQVGSRQDEHYRISLYEVGNFFVEVFKDRCTYQVRHLGVFTKADLPDAYFDNPMAVNYQPEYKLNGKIVCKQWWEEKPLTLLG